MFLVSEYCRRTGTALNLGSGRKEPRKSLSVKDFWGDNPEEETSSEPLFYGNLPHCYKCRERDVVLNWRRIFKKDSSKMKSKLNLFRNTLSTSLLLRYSLTRTLWLEETFTLILVIYCHFTFAAKYSQSQRSWSQPNSTKDTHHTNRYNLHYVIVASRSGNSTD